MALHSVFDGTNCRYIGFEEKFLVFSTIKIDLKLVFLVFFSNLLLIGVVLTNADFG